MFLNCAYLFMNLQKWPTDKNYKKKSAGLAFTCRAGYPYLVLLIGGGRLSF